MDYFSILFHKKFDFAVPFDGKYYEALFAASSGGGWSETTITGTTPIYFKSNGDPLKDYHIFGETVQDGTPSPDYPVDVQGVGERTENLFDAKKIVNDSDNVSTFIYGDYLRFGTGPKTMIINVNANSEGSYTISFDVFNETVGGNNIRFSVSYDDGTTEITPNFVISDTGRHKYTFTTNNNKKLLSFETINTSSKVSYIVIDTAMLIEGTTAIPYEPYGYKIPITIGNTTTPIYIGSDPLYRIGEYADEVDFGNQRLVRRIDPSTMQPYATPITSTITVPQLAATIGDNTLTVDTTVKPSAVSITGNIKPTGYGQLLDINDVDIQDSTGEPIYIQG